MDMHEQDDAALLRGLFEVVAAHGWRGVTPGRLAAASGVPAGELVRRFPSRLGLLRLWGEQVAAAVEQGTVKGQGGTARDRIFDVLMRGMDELQPHRAGLTRLMREMWTDPVLAPALAPVLQDSMRRFLEAAEIDASGPRGRLRAAGLVLVWLRAVNAWSKDEGADLGSTMAALDRALDRAEQAGRSFGLLGGDLSESDNATGA
jgi:AcrR family transcriptional regulator